MLCGGEIVGKRHGRSRARLTLSSLFSLARPPLRMARKARKTSSASVERWEREADIPLDAEEECACVLAGRDSAD